VVERYRDRYATTVATLSQDGLELIQDVDALTHFMRQYGNVLTDSGIPHIENGTINGANQFPPGP